MRARIFALSLISTMLPAGAALAQSQAHNVVLFVADGLRAKMVRHEIAPALTALRLGGVDFANSHSLFPTFTTANASAMATGHYLGDTGDFSNTIYAGFPVPGAGDTVTPFLENDPVLGDIDAHFGGNYLDELTILEAARAAGYRTATIGKLGPALIFDHRERLGEQSVVVDDQTGSPQGIALNPWVSDGLKSTGLEAKAPGRGENGKPGNATTAGTHEPDRAQGDWFTAVATKVVLPAFKQEGKPFVMVFWSRDPDGTQHNQGDSLLALEPGINGPTSLAGIRNADDDLARLRAALDTLGLAETTDVITIADHGFSTISKQSSTSAAAKARYADVPEGLLPSGFVAIDIAKALALPLWDPDMKRKPVAEGSHSRFGNGLIGFDPAKPDVVVAANGGSDLVYFPKGEAQVIAGQVIESLLAQDYVSGLFVDEALGHFPGTLTLADINLKGSAVTPLPAIAISFRSFTTGCDEVTTCTAEVADTGLQQGQGMHGSFSRADTYNFMAAIGPDFRKGFVDVAPVSNVDIGQTIAAILKFDLPRKGRLIGRVLREAMPDEGAMTPAFSSQTIASEPGPQGLRTILRLQHVGDTVYFDAAGFAGRTVGLE